VVANDFAKSVGFLARRALLITELAVSSRIIEGGNGALRPPIASYPPLPWVGRPVYRLIGRQRLCD
jgi:hypothetical protein